MYQLYAIALIPIIIGTILFIRSDKVVWLEWLGSTVLAFIICGIMHGIAIYGMTRDIETRSGEIVRTTHYPAWYGEYTETHTETETDSEGHTTTHTYTDTHHENHPEHWDVDISYGSRSESKEIDRAFYLDIVKNFGGRIQKGRNQSCWNSCDIESGDKSTYVTVNETGYVYPSTITTEFQNKIKAAPTLFSFAKVPSNIPVFEWPKNPNWQVSDRVMGTASQFIKTWDWDLMNSRLGSKKRVNVIIIGFNSADSSLGHWQQAKFVGGKKNDIVICFGHQGTNVVWSYCFGWTEKEICKRNLETIVLNNPMGNGLIPLIEAEIKTGYMAKDWSKFDYLTLNPPGWAYWVLIILMILIQGGYWFWAYINDFDRFSDTSSGRGYNSFKNSPWGRGLGSGRW
jgi:hypothetical protein